MPASKHELDEAAARGYQRQLLVGTARGSRRGQGASGSRSRAASPSSTTKSGSPRRSTRERSEEFEADTVIFAVGQGADAGDIGLELTQRGGIEIDPAHAAHVGRRRVRGGRRGERPDEGHRRDRRRAPRCRQRRQRPVGDEAGCSPNSTRKSVTLGEVPESMKSKLETRRRVQMERLEFYEAVQDVRRDRGRLHRIRSRPRGTAVPWLYDRRAAQPREVRVVPDVHPRLSAPCACRAKVGGYLYFDAEACHACGACASQCPAQAITLEGHSEEEMSRRVERALADPGPRPRWSFACGGAHALAHFPATCERSR